MKLGRNEPCHCGSGRKYKHCHYNDDRAAEAKALKDAADEAAREVETAVDSQESAGADDSSRAAQDKSAAERAAETGRRDHSASRFMRSPPSGGAARSGGKGPGAAPRATRGAQRGS